MKTPQQSYPILASAIGISEIWLKREDLHPYGSHKGRSIPLMIKEYVKIHKLNHFVVSSSGNAAIAAATTVQKHNQNNPENKIHLQIFVGKNIDIEKLGHLNTILKNSENILLSQVENPKQQAFQMDKSGTAKFLRQSTDDIALKGYIELAEELSKIPNLRAIFLPTSSGTTAQALGEAFELLNQKPQIHIVQTTSCHPIAEIFHEASSSQEPSLAGAIVDNIAFRKEKVVEVVKNSGGSGWIVENDEIRAAKELVKQKTGIEISFNSSLSVAGLKQAIKKGWKFEGTIVCLVTGK